MYTYVFVDHDEIKAQQRSCCCVAYYSGVRDRQLLDIQLLRVLTLEAGELRSIGVVSSGDRHRLQCSYGEIVFVLTVYIFNARLRLEQWIMPVF
jgi:hypothetical protein